MFLTKGLHGNVKVLSGEVFAPDMVGIEVKDLSRPYIPREFTPKRLGVTTYFLVTCVIR